MIRIECDPTTIEAARACHVTGRQPAAGDDRPQIVGTDGNTGQGFERVHRRRFPQHAPVSRQDERRGLAVDYVGEEWLARRWKLEPDAGRRLETRVDLGSQPLPVGAAGDRHHGHQRLHGCAGLRGLLQRGRVAGKIRPPAGGQGHDPRCAGNRNEAEDCRQETDPAIHIRPRASRILPWSFDLSTD